MFTLLVFLILRLKVCKKSKFGVFFEITVSPAAFLNKANSPRCDITNPKLCRMKKTNAK